MTPSMSVNFHGATRARVTDHVTFCTLSVEGKTINVSFFFNAPAADVQSIADDLNAVLSPKAKDAQDAE
jgi:hypothetical protein